MTAGKMNSRERVLAAIKGLPVDRVPVFYWLNPHATCRMLAEFHPSNSTLANFIARRMWRKFKQDGGAEAGEWVRAWPLLFEEYGNGTYALNLGADVSIQSPEIISPSVFLTSVRKRNGRLTFKGPFEILMGMGSIYAYPVEPAVTKPQELQDIEFPPVKASQFTGVRKFREKHPDVCVACEILSFQQLLCDYIMGMEPFMLALYDAPGEIEAFLGRLSDWVVEIIWHAARAGADLMCFADDYGTNGRMLISKRMWKKFTYPHLKRFIAVSHEEGVPFMLHSCGYQIPLLEDYIEAELDLLQSFQPGAGNDFESAYAQYGGKLAFATGIDIQRGGRMTPEELRNEIISYYTIGKTKGRFILGTTHMIQYSMPIENLITIFNTVKEIQAGLHN
jgi:uroporphyrinogen-III decarboxylase